MMLCHQFNKAQVMKHLEQVYKAQANTSTRCLVSAPTHPLPPPRKVTLLQKNQMQ